MNQTFVINEINYSSNVPLFVCFFKCKLTHTKLICFRCVVLNKNNILFLFYMLYKFGRACSHSELMKKKLMKQNKQIFFKYPFYFSPKHDLIDDIVLNRLDDKSSYYTERFYLESHVNFFKKINLSPTSSGLNTT